MHSNGLYSLWLIDVGSENACMRDLARITAPEFKIFYGSICNSEAYARLIFYHLLQLFLRCVFSVRICSHWRSFRNVRKCLWKILPDPFKISFFKYGIFEIIMLIELGLTSLVFNGSKNLVIFKVIQFVRAVGTSYDCCKVPLVWIFVINYFLKGMLAF